MKDKPNLKILMTTLPQNKIGIIFHEVLKKFFELRVNQKLGCAMQNDSIDLFIEPEDGMPEGEKYESLIELFIRDHGIEIRAFDKPALPKRRIEKTTFNLDTETGILSLICEDNDEIPDSGDRFAIGSISGIIQEVLPKGITNIAWCAVNN